MANISSTILNNMGDNGSYFLKKNCLKVSANVIIDFNGHTTSTYKFID
jgi:hypothetical protein